MAIQTNLTPLEAKKLVARLKEAQNTNSDYVSGAEVSVRKFVDENVSELTKLPPENFNSPRDNQNYYNWYRVIAHLAPTYIPRHEAMLNAIAAIDGSGGQLGMAND